MILNNTIKIKMNRLLFWLLITFYSCNMSYADKYHYWDELSDKSRNEIVKLLNLDENIMKLYLHQITLSDDNISIAILDTLCMPTEGNKRMLYFHIMNETVKCADGAFAELLSEYCIKYINENADYVLEYFSKHHDVGNVYSTFIATELYFSNTSITQYEQHLLHSVKGKCAKNYLPIFFKEVEHELNSIIDK